MYEIIKSVIKSGRYELTDMLKKIDTIWLQGDITDEQKEELVSLARNNAIAENSYADLQKQVGTLFTNYSNLEKRVIELEKANDENPDGSETPEEPVVEDEYKEYVQPTGAHDAYHAGDKVLYNGKKYICIAPEGVAVVWSPDVYPAYWELVVETEEEPTESEETAE